MKKIIIVGVIILAIGGFILFQKGTSTDDQTVNAPLTGQTPGATGNVSYKDGSYTGNVSTLSQYGDIQVKAVIGGGKITDIQFIQFPSGSGHTNEVSQMAEPILKQEAISAQSANVNIVSGATQDTQAFIESLQSALDQAKI